MRVDCHKQTQRRQRLTQQLDVRRGLRRHQARPQRPRRLSTTTLERPTLRLSGRSGRPRTMRRDLGDAPTHATPGAEYCGSSRFRSE